ncbi:hypothetical protein HY489_01480 [Candidatus Woesearchaeota archaeon]|nr:hypothetical protein [Candidatus Woesearchaeota archaeon]
MAMSRRAKIGIAVLAAALAGGIAAAINPPRKSDTAASTVASEIADVSSDAVLKNLFENASRSLAVVVDQIRSGNGKIDTNALHADIARMDSALRTAMAQPSSGTNQRERGRLAAELADLQSKLHALDTDAEFLVSFARMHQDKLTNLQRMYSHEPNLVSFCTAITGYLNNTLRAPPAQHANWPDLLLTLHSPAIEGLIAMVDVRVPPHSITPEEKAALSHLLITYPEVMTKVPALRKLIEKHLR